MVGGASGAVQSFRAISVAPSKSMRRSWGVPQWHQHASTARSTGPVVARCSVVKGCSIASGRALARGFAAWAQRDLGELKIRYLFLDGWYPRMRIGKKRVRVPVLVTLGVCADGRRVVLDLRLAGVESANAWLDAVRSLGARNLGAPLLAVVDGNPGLAAALRVQWPQMALQRCTNHKLWNLLAKAPAHLREELAEDYRQIIYAESRESVEHARIGFARKWKLRCKTISASFEEAGDELFTFPAFPISQWKALRTTNALERIDEEFGGGSRPRLRSPARRRFCSCFSASCAVDKLLCAALSAGTT